MDIEYRKSIPNIEQFCALFTTTGWNDAYHATAEELELALANSQFVVSVYSGKLLVGVGRVVTDGVLHAMIYEMIVLPEWQSKGIGTQILKLLLEWCEQRNIRDIQLFCARGKRSFYEKNGFLVRPEDSPGMQYRRLPE